jgi:D-3-phosphoglycerate dehydrogenase / 2-oxoglutarate reductase
VARRARAGFGMQVIATDPQVGDSTFEAEGVERATLEEVLARSDVVSVHVPRSSATLGLLGRDELGQMRSGAVLVNTSRGSIVDEGALVAALDEGHLAGAVVDVFDEEPPSSGHPLLGRPDVIATPHVAGMSEEAMFRLTSAMAANVLGALRGERPPHVANPEAWPPRRVLGVRGAA